MSDKNTWTELIEVITQISDCYSSMIDLAEEKKHSLIKVNIQNVNKIIIKEEKILKKINVLETRRIELVESIANKENWQEPKIKLLDIVQKAPLEFADKMKQVGQDMADIIMQMTALNNVNNNLLKQALQIVEYNINFLSQAKATPFYDAGGSQGGNTKDNAGLTVFDRKA